MLKYLRLLYYLFYRPKIFFPKKNYSMFGEDKFINNYFRKKSKGFYIDVGCYHPLDGNNSYILYKRGWNGINFDINQYSIKLFNFLRKRDINIHSGISVKKKKANKKTSFVTKKTTFFKKNWYFQKTKFEIFQNNFRYYR